MYQYNSPSYLSAATDGTNQHLNMYTNKAYNEYVPFKDYDYTYLKITNEHHDVNLINKNFINVTAKFKITPKRNLLFEYKNYYPGTTRDDVEANVVAGTETNVIDRVVSGDVGKKLYIGWKNSSEIIQEMTVLNNNRETGYQQIYSDRENYLESTKFKTATEKDLARDCHFAYYNYKENLEGEVPGLLIEDNTTIRAPEDIPNYDPANPDATKTELPYPVQSQKIYIISQAFLDKFPNRIGSLKLNEWNDFSQEDFQEIVYYWEDGYPNYILYEDFIFDFYFDKDGGNYHTLDEGDSNEKTFKDFKDAVDNILAPVTPPDTKRHIVYDATHAGDAILSYQFINQRIYRWNTTDVYTATISLVIPLRDLPAFNSMDYFERPFGDIVLKMMFGARSLMIFSNLQKCQQYTSSDFNISDFTITNLTCECYGYNISGEGVSSNDEVWAPIRSKFGDGERNRIYEARFTDFKNFEGNIEGGRFNIEFPAALEMVKYIHMVFPRTTNDTTVFRNPFLMDVKLKIDGILYPREENLRTDNRMFYHIQSGDNDLDDDVKYSYTCPALNAAKNGPLQDANKKADLDDSNFIITWELAVGHFMAIHRYGDNVNINFTAEIIHFLQSMYGVSTLAREYSNDEPSPQIWFTHDSCWKLNLRDGLVFMRNTCPSYDIYNNDKEDLLYMK